MEREKEIHNHFKKFWCDARMGWSQEIKSLRRDGVKQNELVQEVVKELLFGTQEIIFEQPKFSFELFEKFISPYVNWEEIAEYIVKENTNNRKKEEK